jgi:hypothetical protein
MIETDAGNRPVDKLKGKTLTEFSTLVSGAANSFPPKNFEKPKTSFLLTAYVLARNCGAL